MMRVVAAKNEFKAAVAGFMKTYRVVAPVRDEDVLEFREIDNIDDIDDIVLSNELTYKSPKEFLFPQSEKLMSFDGSGNLIPAAEPRKTVIIGIKPCDLEALKVMTAVFTTGKFIDEAFARHLENTVLIGFGCTSQKPACFCGERGVSMSFSCACDAFITEMGDRYSIELISEKGIDIFKESGFEVIVEKPEGQDKEGFKSDAGGVKLYGDAADTGDMQSNEGFKSDVDGVKLYGGAADTGDMQSNEGAVAACASQDITGPDIIEINVDENELFSRPDWERISEKCIGCGMCTYICPTCHCFEFRDTAEKGIVNRYRCWDSCMYPKFTLHASGHNPRASKKERYRQRIMHKYLYVKKNFGYIACTGCGRCIRSCPGGMNIKSVVRGLMEELK